MSTAPSTNPYAPPEVPVVAQPVQIDFRVAAVEESLRILEANPGRDPDELGVSLVLPADVRGPQHLRYIARMTLVRLVVGIAGLAAGALLSTALEKFVMWAGVPNAATLAGTIFFGGGGMVLLLVNAMLIRWSVIRAL